MADAREFPKEAAGAPETIQTAFGGVFFLMDIALYLLIYGDFSQPGEMGLELDLWDFISLIGYDLTNGGIEEDPLWLVLAHLARRGPGQEPGHAFNAPQSWQLPGHWLEPFPEEFDPRPSESQGRLVCVHPAGFVVSDLCASSDEPAKARPDQATLNLKRWVGWMSGYIRQRLVRALGREDAVALLCRQQARVTLRPTHVDVTFSLNHHPIELRMAGLDRDPGWIPAAGCYVAFHFE
jgi:hypothetical protein